MRVSAVWLCVGIGLLMTVAPAEAKRPPRPLVASHGVKAKAGYIGQCPRRDRDCAIPAFFATTTPVPVHKGGVLRVNTRRHVRRLHLSLDCPHRKQESSGNRRWTFEILGDGCTSGELDVTYRRIVAVYTFSVERHEHCQPDGSATVAENDFARIYSVYSTRDTEDGRESETTFVACRFDSGRFETLGRVCDGCYYSGQDYFDHLVLAEEKVTYVSWFWDTRYENQKLIHLKVFDARGFRIQRDIYFETPNSAGDYDLDITAVVLKTNGSVAWILHRCRFGEFGPCTTQTYDVRKSDQTGGDVLVESSPDIDPASLRLDGSTLTWTRSGEPRSATLD